MRIKGSTTGEIYFTISHRRQAFIESIHAKKAALDPDHPMYNERLQRLLRMEREIISNAIQSHPLNHRRTPGRSG